MVSSGRWSQSRMFLIVRLVPLERGRRSGCPRPRSPSPRSGRARRPAGSSGCCAAMYGPLEVQLVGLDPVASGAARGPRPRPAIHSTTSTTSAGHQEAPARPEHLEHARGRAQHREHHQPLQHRQRGVHVGVGGAEHEPARRVEQVEAVEPEADRPETSSSAPRPSRWVRAPAARRGPRAVSTRLRWST